jgi:hypothetical protein
MRRTVIGAAVITALATLVMGAALLLFPEQGALVLKVYFTVLGLLLCLRLIREAGAYVYGDGGSAVVQRNQRIRRPLPNWPADLFELADRVSLARVSAFDYQSRLRPFLRDLAAQRLAARWNVDLSRQPGEAERRLGHDLWNEIQDVPNTDDLRDRPGPSIARLRTLVDGVESI